MLISMVYRYLNLNPFNSKKFPLAISNAVLAPTALLISSVLMTIGMTGLVGCSSSSSSESNLYYESHSVQEPKEETRSYLYDKDTAQSPEAEKEPVSGIEYGAVTDNSEMKTSELDTGEEVQVRRKLDRQKEYLKELRKQNPI